MNKTKIGFSLLGIALIGGGIGLSTSLISCSNKGEIGIDLLDFLPGTNLYGKRLVFNEKIDWSAKLDAIGKNNNAFYFALEVVSGDMFKSATIDNHCFSYTISDNANGTYIGDMTFEVGFEPVGTPINSYFENGNWTSKYKSKKGMTLDCWNFESYILNCYSDYGGITMQDLEDAGLRGWCKVFDIIF